MLITQYLKTYFESQVVKQYGWDTDMVNGGGQVIPLLLCVIRQNHNQTSLTGKFV